MSTTSIYSTFADKISQIIYPQITQLMNIHITKHINTGDRMQDNVYILIANTLFTMSIAWIWHWTLWIYEWFTVNNLVDVVHPNRLNVANILKTVSLETVNKYPYCVTVHGSSLVEWAKREHIVDEIHATKQLKYTATAAGSLSLNEDENGMAGVFIPVYKYTDSTGKTEYVFYNNNNLFSQSLHALETLYKNLHVCLQEPVKIKTYESTVLMVQDIAPADSGGGFKLDHRGHVNDRAIMNRIHFDQKELLLFWLKQFSDRTIYPNELCLPNKLGILLYGPPGTGKTGCISAIANHLRRSVLRINSLSISGKSKNSFLQTINKLKKSHVFVFDEIDYILNVKAPPAAVAEDSSRDKLRDQLMFATSDEERKEIIDSLKQAVKQDTEKDAHACIDERFVLQMFDGSGDDEDRIIIGTTNYPEMISAAMCRPGRFDLVLNLGYCSVTMFRNIVKTKFPDVVGMLDGDEVVQTKVAEMLLLNITPLVLINNLVSAPTIEILFENLSKLSPSSYNHKPNNSM